MENAAPARYARRLVIGVIGPCALLAAGFLVYCGLAVYYGSLKPNPKSDKYEAILSALPPCPPEQSAWYAYMDAMHPRHLGDSQPAADEGEDGGEDEGEDGGEDGAVIEGGASAETNMLRTTLKLDEALVERLREVGITFDDDTFESAYVASNHALMVREAVDSGAAYELVARVVERFAPTRAALIEASKVPVFGVRRPTERDSRSTIFFMDHPFDLDLDLPESRIGDREASFLVRIAGLLDRDAEHALRQGDAERALVDIETIARMARHADEPRSIDAQLSALRLRVRVCAHVARSVSSHPTLWSDAQLSRLERVLDEIDGGGRILDLASEEAYFEAITSRLYSDDGAGDGVLILKRVMKLSADGSSIPEQREWTAFHTLTAPLHVWKASTRSELAGDFEAHLAKLRARMAIPLWQRPPRRNSQFVDEPLDEADPVRALLFMDLDRHADGFAYASSARDGARLAIAIERFRRTNGRLPQSMEEIHVFAREQKLEGAPPPWGLAPLSIDVQSGEPYRLILGKTKDGVPRAEIWSKGSDDPGIAMEFGGSGGLRVVPPPARPWED